MSSATVSCPTSCSRCAIRSASVLDCLSTGLKRVAAFSRSCRFHFESCSSLMLCLRHTSAWILSPRKCFKNNFGFKLGGEGSSFTFCPSDTTYESRAVLYHNLGLDSGPNFRGQYKNTSMVELLCVN